jgi:general secretion pathway protein D
MPQPVDETRGSRFVLNFDNADIYEVIRVMAEMMGVNYIVDPRVKGVVNIRTTGQISNKDIFPVLQTILRMNGATAVQKGIIYEIVPFGDAKKMSGRPVTDRDKDRTQENEKYTIQIISLKYVPAPEVSKMIKPFLSDGADIVEHPQYNLLIVGDVASNIQKILDLIDLFDVDVFSETRVRIYPIYNSDVVEVAKEMERIFSSFEVSVKSGRGVGITFTPILRNNYLLAISSIPGIFDKVEKWVKELDRTPGEGTRLSVFVYYVQNGKAKDMAEVLKQVYMPLSYRTTTTTSTSTLGTQTPGLMPGGYSSGYPGVSPSVSAAQSRGLRPMAPAGPEGAAGGPSLAGETGGVTEGQINIVVDETTNSLIIRGYQRDYRRIMETIKKLDIYPKQVLIEVLLAEVTLNDAMKYGLEFSTFSSSFTKGGYAYNYTVGMGGKPPVTDFASGLRYAVTSVDRLAAAINLSATEDRLKVISSPHLLASNNKEARIQVGTSQPILSNTYTTTATGTPGVVEGSIEYKDIGIILTVTPRISDGKLVTLDVSVESSSVGQTQLGNLAAVPFFPKKIAKTTLSIMEGQTIVIGGLIEEQKESINAGVPFLSKIPILGALFGYQTRTKTTTETVVFLTPHVISDLAESNRVTEEFRSKIFTIQKEIERQKKEDDQRRGKGKSKVEPAAPAAGISQSRKSTESIAP